MVCKVANLGVSVPNIGDIFDRCKKYESNIPVDIEISANEYDSKKWPTLSENEFHYLDSGTQFCKHIVKYNGMMLHSSCVLVDGYAYLFSGPCGVGKSTHANKYLETFNNAIIINDDKPALRKIDNVWYAFGTPWCGKDGINENTCAPIAGICFLHRGDRNITRLDELVATSRFLGQTIGRGSIENATLLLEHIKDLYQSVPMFDFYNHAEAGDELITYHAMCGHLKK